MKGSVRIQMVRILQKIFRSIINFSSVSCFCDAQQMASIPKKVIDKHLDFGYLIKNKLEVERAQYKDEVRLLAKLLAFPNCGKVGKK